MAAAAAGAGFGAGGAPAEPRAQVAASEVAKLLRLSEAANDALMRGDAERYRTLTPLTADFTLMSPFGGKPSRGGYTPERWQSIGKFFRNGSLTMELVHSYSAPGMVVLAVIERAYVEVGELPAQHWALRVTLVYRQEEGQWRLAHRHADPLAPGISLERAAALARP